MLQVDDTIDDMPGQHAPAKAAPEEQEGESEYDPGSDAEWHMPQLAAKLLCNTLHSCTWDV